MEVVRALAAMVVVMAGPVAVAVVSSAQAAADGAVRVAVEATEAGMAGVRWEAQAAVVVVAGAAAMRRVECYLSWLHTF